MGDVNSCLLKGVSKELYAVIKEAARSGELIVNLDKGMFVEVTPRNVVHEIQPCFFHTIGFWNVNNIKCHFLTDISSMRPEIGVEINFGLRRTEFWKACNDQSVCQWVKCCICTITSYFPLYYNSPLL